MSPVRGDACVPGSEAPWVWTGFVLSVACFTAVLRRIGVVASMPSMTSSPAAMSSGRLAARSVPTAARNVSTGSPSTTSSLRGGRPALRARRQAARRYLRAAAAAAGSHPKAGRAPRAGDASCALGPSGAWATETSAIHVARRPGGAVRDRGLVGDRGTGAAVSDWGVVVAASRLPTGGDFLVQGVGVSRYPFDARAAPQSAPGLMMYTAVRHFPCDATQSARLRA